MITNIRARLEEAVETVNRSLLDDKGRHEQRMAHIAAFDEHTELSFKVAMETIQQHMQEAYKMMKASIAQAREDEIKFFAEQTAAHRALIGEAA